MRDEEEEAGAKVKGDSAGGIVVGCCDPRGRNLEADGEPYAEVDVDDADAPPNKSSLSEVACFEGGNIRRCSDVNEQNKVQEAYLKLMGFFRLFIRLL